LTPKEHEVSALILDDLPALIPVPVAAQLLGLKRATAYRLAASGELPAKRYGGRIFIVKARIRPIIDGTEGVEP
jgi:excisionase family DNA binding protein